MNLHLPNGAREGSRIAVTWPPSEADKVEPGTWEGEILKILPHKIIVKFIYRPTDNPPSEQISIDLGTGLDSKYHAAVSSIRLLQRSSPR
jgi:hypothetical protein